MNKFKIKNKSISFSLKSGSKILNLNKPKIMGILNITPDSFYDGGKYNSEYLWLKQTEKMLKEGASIIDIGVVSTRPGAKKISEKEELQRLLPVLTSIVKNFSDLIISVDTYRSGIAEIAVQNSAFMINDISGGTFDKKMFDTIAKLQVPYIIMHIKGAPQNMQKNPTYDNVVKEIKNFFSQQIKKLNLKGINDIIIDPGFGFGKTLKHNYEILNNLNSFNAFGLPVLAGISRKSMINKVLNTKPSEALNGTTVLNTICLLKGAKILRVHDVKEAMEVIKIVSQIST